MTLWQLKCVIIFRQETKLVRIRFWSIIIQHNCHSLCTNGIHIKLSFILCIIFQVAWSTHQNPYSISYLLGTVTTQWLPLWQCSHCSLFPARQCDYWTVTTSDTRVISYPLPWGLCENLSTRHLVGNCTVTVWEDTRYPVHIVTV